MSIMHSPAQFRQPAPVLESGHPCQQCDSRQSAICSVLENDELQAFRKSGVVTRLEAGETLFYEGDQVRNVFSVTDGVVRLIKMLPDGRRQVANFLFPGDFLGLTLEDRYAFSAEAVTPVSLCQFPVARFRAFSANHPEMARRLYVLAAQELAAAHQQVLLLGRKSATERIASFLFMLARHGWPAPDPKRLAKAGKITGKVVVLPMSRTDIADYLGLRIETVSRELSGLKAAGIIRLISTQKVEILDEGRLHAIVAGEAEPAPRAACCN